MGWDIALFVEVQQDRLWSLAQPLERNPDFDPQHPEQEAEWRPKEFTVERNSALFAILANICNPTCSIEPFECIDLPRGLPVDVSEPLRVWHAQNDGLTWSGSWLLLTEILEFDWHGKKIIRQAKVDLRVANLFPPGRKGFPYAEWPSEIGIGYWEGGPGVQVTWQETYAEAVGAGFFETTIPRLKVFGPPEKVRVVFWFTY